MYTERERKVDIFARIGVSEEADKLLRLEKRKQGKSKAELTTELILERYGNK